MHAMSKQDVIFVVTLLLCALSITLSGLSLIRTLHERDRVAVEACKPDQLVDYVHTAGRTLAICATEQGLVVRGQKDEEKQ